MKGYYVIGFPNDEPIEITGKNARNRAIKKAKEINNLGCKEVIVQQFDDDNDDGYFAGLESIVIQRISN